MGAQTTIRTRRVGIVKDGRVATEGAAEARPELAQSGAPGARQILLRLVHGRRMGAEDAVRVVLQLVDRDRHASSVKVVKAVPERPVWKRAISKKG